MRMSATAVAVAIAGLGCFSTARFDTAHVRRVADIDARYGAETRQQDDWYASSVAALDQLKASVVAVVPGSRHAPVHRVEDRIAFVECRRHCAGAQCLREICQPAYADALIKTYGHADARWVTHQLSVSRDADLESLLAFSHNQTVLRTVDHRSATLAQQHGHARRRLALLRDSEIRASSQRRDAEIATGRAAHRARVKAAADAFEAMDQTVPTVDRMTYAPPQATREARNERCARDAGCATAP
jgi:hypothetical protein